MMSGHLGGTEWTLEVGEIDLFRELPDLREGLAFRDWNPSPELQALWEDHSSLSPQPLSCVLRPRAWVSSWQSVEVGDPIWGLLKGKQEVKGTSKAKGHHGAAIRESHPGRTREHTVSAFETPSWRDWARKGQSPEDGAATSALQSCIYRASSWTWHAHLRE